MDPIFRHRADINGGYLLRSQIIELGGTDRLIRSACGRGVLRRVRVGTYMFSDVWAHLDPTARHVVVARSVIDKLPPGAVALSHQTVAAVHGLALFDVDLSTVHLTRLDTGPGRIEAGVVHHDRPRGDPQLLDLDGVPVVSAERAMWEVACRTSMRGALVVMDSALSNGLVVPDQLADTSGRYAHWKGSRAARLMARIADEGAETPGESLMRFVCFEHNLPRPETQVEIHDENGTLVARTDLGWQFHRHVGEFDGLRRYLRDLRPGENASDVVIREKVREDAIRRLDRGVSRAIWNEVLPAQSATTAARLEHGLEQSHRLYAKGRRYFA